MMVDEETITKKELIEMFEELKKDLSSEESQKELEEKFRPILLKFKKEIIDLLRGKVEKLPTFKQEVECDTVEKEKVFEILKHIEEMK